MNLEVAKFWELKGLNNSDVGRFLLQVASHNGPFAANGHMVHAGGQAAHWDIQKKENSNLS